LDIEAIVAELKGECERIEQVIGLLEQNTSIKKRVGRPPGSTTKPGQGPRGRLTAAGRRRLSELMKRRWAEKKRKAS
jgi:hypothetical protein